MRRSIRPTRATLQTFGPARASSRWLPSAADERFTIAPRTTRYRALPAVGDWDVKGVGRTNRVEVLAELHDLPGLGSQEQHVVLPVGPARRLDQALRPHLGHGTVRVVAR